MSLFRPTRRQERTQGRYVTEGLGERGQGSDVPASDAAHASGARRQAQLRSWQRRERFAGNPLPLDYNE